VSTSGQATVLVVEDELAIAEPFCRALEREGFSVVHAPRAGAAREALGRDAPDIVLLDIGLPDGDGRELAREIRAAGRTPIIIVSARGTETDRVVGLELGADDYVVKPFSSAEVIARIRAVLRRSDARDDDAQAGRIEIGDVVLDGAERRVWHAGTEVALTRREFDLLERMMMSPGRVLRREQLLSDVWDVNWFGSTKTLDVHIAAVRRKLSEAAPDEHIVTVRGVGFRFVSGEEKP